MNLYEHTIIARQDTSPSQLKQITDKYLNIVEKNNASFAFPSTSVYVEKN